MTFRKLLGAGLAAGSLLAFAAGAANADQGISDDEIVVGSHQPLSGPVAIWGVSVANGLRMRADEANEAGGVNGRKINLIVEDTAYQQSKAAQATDKLLKRDKVFALIGALGTPMNMVSMPQALDRGVPNLFPLTAAKEMYEPFHPLKFSLFTPYYDQMRAAVKWFVEDKGKKRIGVLSQDDDFGKNVLDGCKDQAEEMGLKLVAETTFKRGAKDFSSQIALLKEADADLVCLGTIISETIGAKVAALKSGWNVDMLVSSAGFTPQTAELAKGATDGLYGTSQTPIPYYDTASPETKAWMDSYKARFGKDADLQAIAGYSGMDVFVEAATKAGRDLTAEKLAKEIEKIERGVDMFGSSPIKFGADDHLGPEARSSATMYQIKDSRWVAVGPVAY
ncbi:ABC transporter substrate-binding protein [Oceanibacterium hippocampi]|uniref:Leucine-, isoleucine-, valine-, threonine-, and alanine-binding protein n=1 Tax=Oceanibacterium hippocampi TaxID=745714 RepID=A0A1Y5TU45_9PROT|nr:ABC transporter substrate-binding protein [Oceanibacterium hippocampi]SLN72720.1 Leucine-, isoleucine-, valine-, threonine-, and alanine-binding protein precursor [Oceanibacterium hippocampi]